MYSNVNHNLHCTTAAPHDMADPSRPRTKSGGHAEYSCSNSAKRPSPPQDVMGASSRLDPRSRISYHIRIVVLGPLQQHRVLSPSLPLTATSPPHLSTCCTLGDHWATPRIKSGEDNCISIKI